MMIISTADPRIKLYQKLYGVDATEAKRMLENKEEEKELMNKSNNASKSTSQDKESLNILDAQANMNMYLVHKNRKETKN